MSNLAPFNPVAAIIERSLTIKHVYGEPVQRGDTTVIPVARVVYGFGAGGGQGRRGQGESAAANGPQGEGEGGGGGVVMTPAGALEVGPNGTRFVPVQPLAPLILAGGIGLTLGLLLARRR
jgi:uncharacterized spore protein YtfJ